MTGPTMDAEGCQTITSDCGELLQVMADAGLLVIRQQLDAGDTWQILTLDAGQAAALMYMLQDWRWSQQRPYLTD